jgi:hypothetical protein
MSSNKLVTDYVWAMHCDNSVLNVLRFGLLSGKTKIMQENALWSVFLCVQTWMSHLKEVTA